jgi:multiple sugar transport system substrate-binding protein
MPNQDDAKETVVRDTIIIFLLLTILAGLIIVLISEQGRLLPEITQTPTAIRTLAATPARTPTPAPSLTRTRTPARTSTRTPAPTPVSLKIYMHVFNAETVAWLKREINPVFEAAHPGIVVEIIEGSCCGWIVSPFTDARKFDIVNLFSSELEDNTFRASLADLEADLGPAAWPEAGNFGTALDNARYDGKLLGLPISTSARMVFCRTDLMQAAGWTSGTPRNFAEWVEFSGELSQIDPATNSLTRQAFVPLDYSWMGNPEASAGLYPDRSWWLQVFYSLGGKLYKEDGSPNFDSPEALAATRFLLDMRRATYGPAVNGVSRLPDAPSIDVNDTTGATNAVCLAGFLWAAPDFVRPVWDNISIEPFYGDPTNFPNSTPVVLDEMTWMGVLEHSPNKKLAIAWLKLAFSRQANNRWNETREVNWEIPARIDARYGYIADSPQLQRVAGLASQYGLASPGIYESASLSAIMENALALMFAEQLTPEEVVAKIQAEYVDALEN